MRYTSLTVILALTHHAHTYEHTNINVSQPQSNAPLNSTLAHYRRNGYNGPTHQLTHSFISTSCGANLGVHYSSPSAWDGLAGTASKPILVLIHGYPESSYIWRDISPTMSKRVPVFIPDQSGYGLSSPCCTAAGGCKYDKRTYARAIMQAVRGVYGDVFVVFVRHHRGARTMHRAAIDNKFPGITGLGLFVADIVPFVAEYASFPKLFWAQIYFHWSFLPRGEFATHVIMAYGGGKWVRQVLEYGSGLNKAGTAKFQAGNAWAIYENFFNQLSVTNASVFDYQAAASIDYDTQLRDQGNGTRVRITTHVLYSVYNLGSEFDVEAAWANYTAPSAGLTVKGIGGQKGQFIVEEAPEDTIERLHSFLDRLGVDQSLRG